MGLIPVSTSDVKPPSYSPLTMPILWYGRPGIGKTTMVSKSKPYILATEQGADFVEAHYRNVQTWVDLLKYTKAFFDESENHGFKTLVIDSIDRAWDLCCDHVAQKMGALRISQKGRAGWAAANAEFIGYITRGLMGRAAIESGGWSHGIYWISHEKSSFYTEDGRRLANDDKFEGTIIEKSEPMISHRAHDIVCSSAYIIARCYMGLDGQRLVRCQPNRNTVAKDRTSVFAGDLPLDWDRFCDPLRDAARAQKNG